MKTVLEFNIGLGNNPMDFDAIIRHFDLNPEMGAWFFGQGESTYEGKPETTVHIIAHNTLKYSYILQRVEHLCTLMEQQCIAIKINGQGILVYNPKAQYPLASFDAAYWLDKTPETII